MRQSLGLIPHTALSFLDRIDSFIYECLIHKYNFFHCNCNADVGTKIRKEAKEHQVLTINGLNTCPIHGRLESENESTVARPAPARQSPAIRNLNHIDELTSI